MVVVKDKRPFANIELILMQHLGAVFAVYTDTDTPPDGTIGIQINRLPSTPDDGYTDWPRVRISVFHADYTEAERLSEKIRQEIYALDSGGTILMPPDADVDLAGKTILIDTARSDVPPENEAYANPERVLVSAYYELSLRRPN